MGKDFDPKLKQAVTEIDLIIRKHNIAACVFLVSESHSEYYNYVNPTWSCLGEDLRFNSTRFPKEARQKVMSDTIHLIFHMVGLAHQTNTFSGNSLNISKHAFQSRILRWMNLQKNLSG